MKFGFLSRMVPSMMARVIYSCKYQKILAFYLHRKLNLAWAIPTSDILSVIQCNRVNRNRIAFELYGIVSAFLLIFPGIVCIIKPKYNYIRNCRVKTAFCYSNTITQNCHVQTAGNRFNITSLLVLDSHHKDETVARPSKHILDMVRL